MNPQQIRKIKEYAEKLLGLCIGEPLPPHKTSGNGHWESCERDAYNAGEIQDKCRRAYRKKILDILGDDANDWIFITRTFENLKPQLFSRLDIMRQEILQHTHPDKKQVNWLEPQGGNLNPNKDLISLIKRLANELLRETEKKKKGIFRNLWFIITAIVGFLGSLLGILNHLGWLESFKAFFSKLFTHK
jgi:hypothetical protein